MKPTTRMSASPTSGVGVLLLVSLATVQFLVNLDAAATTIALPAMQRDLTLSPQALQWTSIAYLALGAAVALPAGAISDRYGRRISFAIASLLLAAGGVMCATAGNGDVLVAGRALAGCGGGALTVLSVAILTATVGGNWVGPIVARWTAISSLSAIISPGLSGVLVDVIGWRWLLLVAVAPLLPVNLIIWRRLPDRRGETRPIGWLGLLLLPLPVLLLCSGLSAGTTGSLTSLAFIGPIVLGAIALVVVIAHQRRTRHPIADWRVTLVRPMPAALILLAILRLTITGSIFQQNLLIQNVFGYAPWLAGVLDIGPAILFVLTAACSERLTTRLGPVNCVTGGFVVGALALTGTALIDVNPSVLGMAVTFSLLGIGMGLIVPTLTAAALDRVTPDSRGTAAGFISLSSQLASLLGISLIGAVAASITIDEWTKRTGQALASDDMLNDLVAGSITNMGSEYGSAAAWNAAVAFESGVEWSLQLGALLLLVSGAIGWFVLRRDERTKPGG